MNMLSSKSICILMTVVLSIHVHASDVKQRRGSPPESAFKINTTFYLYNRTNAGQQISIETLAEFNSLIKTCIIIHGFKSSAQKSWVMDMKNALLETAPMNVITCDWSSGSLFPYQQAVANTQVVGYEISTLVNFLIDKFDAKASDFHLIGHSLGAHISGYAGAQLIGLGRISALDPAGLHFENKHYDIRLDPSDAAFVDVIHTDIGSSIGFGFVQHLGNVDYFPNGGFNQPGCPKSSSKLPSSIFSLLTGNKKEALTKLSCSHRAAYVYFIDSIRKKCEYTAFPCDSYDDFMRGDCMQCSESGCNQMGYWASLKRDLGNLYLTTKSLKVDGEFCHAHHLIRLVSNGIEDMKKTVGKISIYLKGKTQTSSTESAHIKLVSGEAKSLLVSFGSELSEDIEDAFVSFQKTSNIFTKWFSDDFWSFKSIEIFSGPKQLLTKFCPLLEIIPSGSTAIFKKCN